MFLRNVISASLHRPPCAANRATGWLAGEARGLRVRSNQGRHGVQNNGEQLRPDGRAPAGASGNRFIEVTPLKDLPDNGTLCSNAR
jgi:hypothetical protein